jgi:hypothetical protein
MIRLRSDCLEFELSNGEKVPCSAQAVTVEIIGPAVDQLDRELVENATAAVLHYFHHDLQKTSVTVSEFTSALEVALRGLGVHVTCESSTAAAPAHRPLGPSDLRRIACASGKEFELGFFTRLRDEMRTQLQRSSGPLRFCGLRSCVKQLSGARRWSPRCQALNDQNVEYLRACLMQDGSGRTCGLVVV